MWYTILDPQKSVFKCCLSLMAYRPSGYLWFQKSDQEYFYSPLDGMLVHHLITTNTEFASTHLYTCMEQGSVRVTCLAQEHNRHNDYGQVLKSEPPI